MRIGLFHTRAGWRHAGGKAIFVRELAAALAAEHDVTVYTQFDPGSGLARRLRAAGVRLVDLPRGPEDSIDAVIERVLPVSRDPLFPLVESISDGVTDDIDRRVDVLLTHRFLEDLLLSNVVDVPVAYQYHNVKQVGAGAKLRERFSKAAIHLANSETIAGEVEAKLGRTVDGIVYPGVDTETFSPDADSLAADRTLPGEETVLFVGRVVPAKGIFDLVDAVARASSEPNLVVAGSGAVEEVRERAASLGIADRVRFEGEIDHDDLPGYYAGADVFCNPTHYEGFGMTNVEAMACGTPVVTTRLPSITEYATDGENAVLVEPEAIDSLATALDSLLASPARRAHLGVSGRETAETFDWSAQAERLVDICRAKLAVATA